MTITKNLSERLSIEEASKLRKELNDLLDRGENTFIINFRDCQFIDSTGLGVVVASFRRCLQQNGNLILCCIKNPQVQEILALTRLDRVFTIYATYEDALKAYENHSGTG
ncbi:MAG: STAS domain-containing protein [Peptococcaceae bacterium]